MSLDDERAWRMLLLGTRLRLDGAEQSLAEADHWVEKTHRQILASEISVARSDELLERLNCSTARPTHR
jgi:hypothetical protein